MNKLNEKIVHFGFCEKLLMKMLLRHECVMVLLLFLLSHSIYICTRNIVIMPVIL